MAHGQLLRDHIAQLKGQADHQPQYEAFRDIYNRIKSDLGGVEYCEALTSDKKVDSKLCVAL